MGNKEQITIKIDKETAGIYLKWASMVIPDGLDCPDVAGCIKYAAWQFTGR